MCIGTAVQTELAVVRRRRAVISAAAGGHTLQHDSYPAASVCLGQHCLPP